MDHHNIFKSFLAAVLTVVLNFENACLHPSRDLAAHDFPV